MLKNLLKFSGYMIVALVLFLSCNEKTEKNGQEIKIARKEGDLIIADFSKLNDTILFPLSKIVEGLQIVRLDNSDDALTSSGMTYVTDNYILIKSSRARRVEMKLFDRQTGKFLNNIGSQGRGPFEYLNIYDFLIDELNNKVYLLPWQTDRLICYDLKGNPLKEIPLAYHAPKGVFSINPDNSITIAVVPFSNAVSFVWTQDIEGNVLNEIPAEAFTYPGISFSEEIHSKNSINNRNEKDVYLFTFMNRRDSLYRYNYKTGELKPVFTVEYPNFADNQVPIHTYAEIEHYFFGQASFGMVQTAPGMAHSKAPFHYYVNKETLMGNVYKLYNDLFTDEICWPNFSNGYFIMNSQPETLMNHIKKYLDSDKVDAERAKKLKEFYDSTDENDNNIIFIGKLK